MNYNLAHLTTKELEDMLDGLATGNPNELNTDLRQDIKDILYSRGSRA